jgi:hypothetical protein
LKKIFSILLCLAMLVSLAALTTTPVSAAEVCVCPTLSPASGTYDLTNPTQVAVTITWGNATKVDSVSLCNGTALTPSTDYVVFSNLLVIKSSFLSSVLKDCGDCVCLQVQFDVCAANFIITATGKDAKLAPTSRQWVLGSADSANTTIVWSDVGNNITTIAFKEVSGKSWLDYGTDYIVVPNADNKTGNLTITNSFLKDELLTLGSSVKLDIDMDICANVTFTVTAVATAAPSISPMVIPYCIGCCHNVSVEIDWGDAPVGQILSIEDITIQQAALPLFGEYLLGMTMETLSDVVLSGAYGHWTSDYWMDDDNDTLIFNGCHASSGNATIVDVLLGLLSEPPLGLPAWGGLACSLDGFMKGANLIQITFNDTCQTSVILEIDAACVTQPTLTPSDIVFDLDAWKCDATGTATAAIGAVISLGTATCINYIEDISMDEDCNHLPGFGLNLTPLVQWYMAYSPMFGGNLLAIERDTYLLFEGNSTVPGANWTAAGPLGATRTLLVHWLPAVEEPPCCAVCNLFPDFYAPTTVTITTTGIGASISPTKADFNLDSPADVTAAITYGNWATNVTGVTGLTYPDDYTVSGTTLTIKASYLSSVLSAVGDQVVLTVKFDQGASAKLTVTAVGTPLCFIATAAGANAPQLDTLRGFRDVVMRPNALGAKLISLYYAVSPPIAQFISQCDVLRAVVRVGLVDPLAALLGAL